MNKRAVITEVSKRSGISLADCETVLNTFEEVFTDELDNSRGKGNIFDTVYKVMNYLNCKRNNKKH